MHFWQINGRSFARSETPTISKGAQFALPGHVRVASASRSLAADFGAPLAYYPEPTLLGFRAMLRPESQSECGPRKTGV
jgi:hypothetical protein